MKAKAGKAAAAAAERAPAVAAFSGFTPRATAFFTALRENNNRDWFLGHKADYERDVRAPLGALVETLAFAFAARDISLRGDAKSALFRLNRDIRFSKDKNPYKTNAGAVLSRDGTKAGKGLLYFQIGGAADAFMALGFYAPDPQDLAAFRGAIAAAPQAWLKTELALRKESLALSRDDALVRMPKGFEGEAGSAVADVLKLKHFVVRRQVAEQQLYRPALVDDIVAFALAGRPLLDFGWRTLAASGRF